MSSAHNIAVSLLVLDDNPGSLELLSSALSQPGLEILTSSDPEEGLELFHKRRPQIVLTDSGIDGKFGDGNCQRLLAVYGA